MVASFCDLLSLLAHFSSLTQVLACLVKAKPVLHAKLLGLLPQKTYILMLVLIMNTFICQISRNTRKMHNSTKIYENKRSTQKGEREHNQSVAQRAAQILE